LKQVCQIERQAAVHLLERRFSIHKTCVRTDIPIVIRLVDQIPDGLDIRIATLAKVASEHVFSESIIGHASDGPDRGAGRNARRLVEHVDQLRDAVCRRLPVGVNRKEIWKLLGERPVAIERSILVDATLE
jgi:hypothetical protein